jgi:hypothetical protein
MTILDMAKAMARQGIIARDASALRGACIAVGVDVPKLFFSTTMEESGEAVIDGAYVHPSSGKLRMALKRLEVLE